MNDKEYIENISCDVLVVGSGGTGSQAVQAAAEEGLDVLVISKDPMSSSDTKICEGVITVREAGDISDTEEVLSENIKLAGADLPDKKITAAFAKDSKEAYDRLRENGLRPSINFETDKPKTLAIAMGGHNKSRSVGHKNSGLAFGHTNWDTIIKYDNVRYFEDCWFLEIVRSKEKNLNNELDGYVVGGIAYDACRGKLIIIKHNDKFLSAYAYNSDLLVNEGDIVKAGQKISEMGQDQSGRNILHFEIRLNGNPINPLKYLPKNQG